MKNRLQVELQNLETYTLLSYVHEQEQKVYCVPKLISIHIRSVFAGRKRNVKKSYFFRLSEKNYLSLLDVVAQFLIFDFKENIFLRVHPKYLCIKRTGSRNKIQVRASCKKRFNTHLSGPSRIPKKGESCNKGTPVAAEPSGGNLITVDAQIYYCLLCYMFSLVC